MATEVLIGGAPDIAQVTGYKFTGTYSGSDIITVTVGSRSFTVTLGTTTTLSGIASTMVAAVNANDATTGLHDDEVRSLGGQQINELTEVTASVDPSDAERMLLTADTAGKPFTVTITENAGSGGITTATDTAATGAKFADNSVNYLSGNAPSSGDIVLVDWRCANDVIYGWENVAALSAFRYDRASVKLAPDLIDRDNTAKPYTNYRNPWTRIEASVATFVGRIERERGSGAVAPQMRIELYGSNNQTWEIRDGTRRPTDGTATVEFSRASGQTARLNLLNLFGHVQSTCPMDDIYNGSSGNSEAVCSTRIKAPIDAHIYRVLGGFLEIDGEPDNPPSEMTIYNKGTLALMHDDYGGLTPVVYSGGKLIVDRVVGLTSAEIYSGGTLDLSREQGAKTITNVVLHPGASIVDPDGSADVTNWDLPESGWSAIKGDTPAGLRWSTAAIP